MSVIIVFLSLFGFIGGFYWPITADRICLCNSNVWIEVSAQTPLNCKKSLRFIRPLRSLLLTSVFSFFGIMRNCVFCCYAIFNMSAIGILADT